MGCLSGNSIEVINDENQKNKYFDAYKEFKTVYTSLINNNNKESLFLIKTSSITNFLKLIKDSNIMNNLNEKNLEELEKNLQLSFCKQYNLDNEIKIFSDYSECESLLKEGNIKENEFIMVNKAFMDNMGIKITDGMEVSVNTLQKKIKFNSGNELDYKEKENDAGIFIFIEKENQNLKKTNFISNDTGLLGESRNLSNTNFQSVNIFKINSNITLDQNDNLNKNEKNEESKNDNNKDESNDNKNNEKINNKNINNENIVNGNFNDKYKDNEIKNIENIYYENINNENNKNINEENNKNENMSHEKVNNDNNESPNDDKKLSDSKEKRNNDFDNKEKDEEKQIANESGGFIEKSSSLKNDNQDNTKIYDIKKRGSEYTNKNTKANDISENKITQENKEINESQYSSGGFYEATENNEKSNNESVKQSFISNSKISEGDFIEESLADVNNKITESSKNINNFSMINDGDFIEESQISN